MQIINLNEAREKGLTRYFTGKPCKQGHISERYTNKSTCVECMYLARDKWKAENPIKSKESRDKYRIKTKIAKSKYHKDWYKKNREDKLKKNKEWRDKNPDKEVERSKRFRKNNPEYQAIRSSIVKIQSNWRGTRKDAEKMLGYTYQELRDHIESQFEDGMSWERRSEFHVDHIKPIKAFLDEGITDPKIINALSNLQPLWAKDNLSKGAKWEE